MTIFYQALLIAHIFTAAVALASAVVPVVSAKGGTAHRRFGRVFAYSMAIVVITAILLFIMDASLFLLFVALFSGYLVFTGVRAAQLKRKPARGIDKFSNFLAWLAVGGLLLVAFSVGGVSGDEIDDSSVSYVAAAFALILGCFAGYDLFRFFHPVSDAMDWWFRHMTRMLSGIIAAVSAFSVINMNFLPEIVQWLWPTVIGTVGITYGNVFYRRKFNRSAVLSGH